MDNQENRTQTLIENDKTKSGLGWKMRIGGFVEFCETKNGPGASGGDSSTGDLP